MEVVFYLDDLFNFIISISSYFTTISELFWVGGWRCRNIVKILSKKFYSEEDILIFPAFGGDQDGPQIT